MVTCCARDVEKGSKRHFFMAVASVILAAVALVAIAIPVTNAMRQHQQNASKAASDALRPPINGSTLSRVGAESVRMLPELASVLQPVPAETPACNGVPGLCSVPVRLATFPGTHNSMAIKNREFIAESQHLSFKEQLQAGVRMFDIDYAGAQHGTRFGHCFSCFCSFAANAEDSDPAQVFKVMAEFLTSNPRDVIVIGLSNINCGDKAAARQQLLQVLADSPLALYLATAVVGANTTLGELVQSNQRVVLLFYDEWTTSTGYKVGNKDVPNQPLFRIYGGDTKIDAKDAAAIDTEVAVELTADISNQLQAKPPSTDMPWRVLGLFPSTCRACRNAAQCGAISCAVKANSEPYVFYQLAKATIQWLLSQGQQVLVPAFNGYQIDYFGSAGGSRALPEATKRLNQGFAWMYTMRPADAGKQGLGNCVWMLDDAAYAGGLVCVHHGQTPIDSLLSLGSQNSEGTGSGTTSSVSKLIGRKLSEVTAATAATTADAVTIATASGTNGRSSRWVLLPGNAKLQLQLFQNGKLRRQVLATAGKLTWVDVGDTADAVQVLWPMSKGR